MKSDSRSGSDAQQRSVLVVGGDLGALVSLALARKGFGARVRHEQARRGADGRLVGRARGQPALRQGLRRRAERAGYRVSRVDVGRDIAAVLQVARPDAALNVLHGRPGEDGTLQGMLEILGIPYSHSGVMSSALAMQKDVAKVVMAAAGVPVPEGKVVSRREAAAGHPMPRPYVIKPIAEGSSVGVFIVTEQHEHPPQELTRADWAFGEQIWSSAISRARN